ncbi:hypothetical protein AB0J80_17285 [Actinoplanes sp. NPDC049548]|uniref:hypothetical protein n=1 Tax=Actinoplanes sp. NPDC049548 TaxID=3155152 RepID=UPI00342AAF5F
MITSGRRVLLGTALALPVLALGTVTVARPLVSSASVRPHPPVHTSAPVECSTPSIDRLQQWLASGEGTTVPATGSLLVPRGDAGYAAKATFVNDEWHVLVVWLANQFEAQVDLSSSKGFWLTYRATDDLYVQLRPASHWSGGDKWLTLIPATGGRTVTRFFSFAADHWSTLPELGAPAYPFAEALVEARGLVFVGKTPNTIEFDGLRIDGYQPPCR